MRLKQQYKMNVLYSEAAKHKLTGYTGRLIFQFLSFTGCPENKRIHDKISILLTITNMKKCNEYKLKM